MACARVAKTKLSQVGDLARDGFYVALVVGNSKYKAPDSNIPEAAKDHVCVISFDTGSGVNIRYPLDATSCDYAAAKASAGACCMKWKAFRVARGSPRSKSPAIRAGSLRRGTQCVGAGRGE